MDGAWWDQGTSFRTNPDSEWIPKPKQMNVRSSKYLSRGTWNSKNQPGSASCGTLIKSPKTCTRKKENFETAMVELWAQIQLRSCCCKEAVAVRISFQKPQPPPQQAHHFGGWVLALSLTTFRLINLSRPGGTAIAEWEGLPLKVITSHQWGWLSVYWGNWKAIFGSKWSFPNLGLAFLTCFRLQDFCGGISVLNWNLQGTYSLDLKD